MYAVNSKVHKINDLTYHLFCCSNGEIESHQLPPCRDCLYKHVLHANYQAKIWKNSLVAKPDIPSPVGHGWKLDTSGGSGQLVIDWMDGQPAPQVVLDLLTCSCSRSCKLPSCECTSSGLKCTDMCKLRTCDNQAENEDSVSLELDVFADEDSDGE